MTTAPSGMANKDRGPEVKFCQTDKLLLISVMEGGLFSDQVNVSIESDRLSIEIAREGIQNTILTGKLFKCVDPDQCRVRLKYDCVVVKLRKTESCRWYSILKNCTDEAETSKVPTSRVEPTTPSTKEENSETQDDLLESTPGVHPQEREEMFRTDLTESSSFAEEKPIEPRDEARPTTKTSGVTQAFNVPPRSTDAPAELQTSESKVCGTFEHLQKSLNDGLLNSNSFVSTQTSTDEVEVEFGIDFPLPHLKQLKRMASE